MRHLLLIIIFTLCLVNNLAHAQTPVWQWVKSASGNHFDIAVRSCTDANGNLIVTGSYFSTPLDFQNSVIIRMAGMMFSLPNTMLLAMNCGCALLEMLEKKM